MEYDVQALSIEETRRRKTLSDEARNIDVYKRQM